MVKADVAILSHHLANDFIAFVVTAPRLSAAACRTSQGIAAVLPDLANPYAFFTDTDHFEEVDVGLIISPGIGHNVSHLPVVRSVNIYTRFVAALPLAHSFKSGFCEFLPGFGGPEAVEDVGIAGRASVDLQIEALMPYCLILPAHHSICHG